MKLLLLNLTFLFSLFAVACSNETPKVQANASAPAEPEICYQPNAIINDTIKKSIKCAVTGKIGAATVTVNYYSPKVRGRAIWGGLVPYGEVWVTGAHRATHVVVDKAFDVNGTAIPAGTYALFTIPGKETWTIILNKNWEQHLADDYDPKDDLVRVQVKPETNAPAERLEYFVENGDDGQGAISVAWESLKVSLPFKVKA